MTQQVAEGKYGVRRIQEDVSRFLVTKFHARLLRDNDVHAAAQFSSIPAKMLGVVKSYYITMSLAKPTPRNLENSAKGWQVQLAILKLSLPRLRLHPHRLGIHSIISRLTLSQSFSGSVGDNHNYN